MNSIEYSIKVDGKGIDCNKDIFDLHKGIKSISKYNEKGDLISIENGNIYGSKIETKI